MLARFGYKQLISSRIIAKIPKASSGVLPFRNPRVPELCECSAVEFKESYLDLGFKAKLKRGGKEEHHIMLESKI